MKLKHTLPLVAAGCFALGTAAFAQPAPGNNSADQTTNANDRASGRDTNGARDSMSRQPSGTVTDAARGTAADASNMNGNGADSTISQQLTAIQRTPEKAGDKLFVLEAATGNQWEIEFGRLVAERATNPKVKEAAQHIVSDHQAAQAKLADAAKELNVTLPTGLPSMKQQKLEIFRSLPVDKLEKTFVCDGRADHAKDIMVYQDEARDAENTKLKAYASEQLPKLHDHAQMIQTAGTAVGLPAPTDTARTE